MIEPKAFIWTGAPEPGIPEPPVMLFDGSDLWLAYEGSQKTGVAVVRFVSVIDHHLWPINDEGLGKHPYSKAGLEYYSFHELTGTKETEQWAVLGARHWVITFKDDTLDVVARACEVIVTKVPEENAMSTLLKVLPRDKAQPGGAAGAATGRAAER